MRHDPFSREAPYDIYTLDGSRQKPILTRSQARKEWRKYKDFIFYQNMMQSSTSYRICESDTELVPPHQQATKENLDSWYDSILAEQEQRAEELRRWAAEVQKGENPDADI